MSGTRKPRKLIFVSHQAAANISASEQKTAVELLAEFNQLYQAIKTAEQDLYGLADRHLPSENTRQKTENLDLAIAAFLDKMPKVFDPFAGGGAIPLEAARLGCQTYGNDINPVAHIIQKGSLEFPQKYGKPITYSKAEFLKLYGLEEWDKLTNENMVIENGETVAANIPNRLSFDVAFYAHLAPDGSESNSDTPLAWPANLLSLGHGALPFPPDDPVYRFLPGSGRNGIPSIGSWLLGGENGAVTITLGSLTRLRSNPFWTLIDEKVGTLITADLGKPH